MKRIPFFPLLVIIGALTAFLIQAQPGVPGQGSLTAEYQRINKLYEYADNASERHGVSLEEEERLNEEVRKGFVSLLAQMDKTGLRNDTIRFFCLFKSGEIDHYFGRLTEAQQQYRAAIEVKKKIRLDQDSTLFKPLLYSGNIYYSLGNMDSALYQFKEAEKIADLHPNDLNETGRLFNSLGALFYETGNFRQASNYFAKAVATLPKTDVNYKEFLVSYKNNLAATFTKLEEYDQAIGLYEQILPFNISRNDILHNMGIINLNLGSVAKSLAYFRQVPLEGPVAARLANNFGLAYFNLRKFDSARHYLQVAEALNRERNGARKNSTYGLTLKYMGDILTEEGDPATAVGYYHKAIIQFDNDFNNPDIYVNPGAYSGIFSYIHLFNTLSAKASAFERWYKNSKDIRHLESALDAYRSAFRLAEYVERNYDSDEARLFLNRIKYNIHHQPIEACITLHRLTGKPEFLEEAYLFDQRNKASILSLNLQEAELKNRGDIPADLVQQENKVRRELTRLSIKAGNINDSVQLSNVNSQIRDQEIELGRIQEKMRETGKPKELTIAERIPSLEKLTGKILDSKTALLSYHLSEDEMLAYVISQGGIHYQVMPTGPAFFARVDSFLSRLRQTGQGSHRDLMTLSGELYQQLIRPLRTELNNIERLVIIPDDELNYVPFETLQDENGRYLLEDFSIQYQYTTALLDKRVTLNNSLNKTLGLAPFGSPDGPSGFDPLPYSENELKGLSGNILYGNKATKDSLLFYANKYPVIHFATHARANDEEPLQSFISLYPADSQYRLYAREIYDLRLDSTNLVILSACETGTGQLVHGEGMMSLTRAFSYAGCPNIIASLWKAEDKTTSIIVRGLHEYLQKGYTKDAALRQAKLDLLNNESVDPAMKTPEYWGHLIYLGEFETTRQANIWALAWPALLITVILLMLSLVRKEKPGPS